jgi:hypothetical protein
MPAQNSANSIKIMLVQMVEQSISKQILATLPLLIVFFGQILQIVVVEQFKLKIIAVTQILQIVYLMITML